MHGGDGVADRGEAGHGTFVRCGGLTGRFAGALRDFEHGNEQPLRRLGDRPRVGVVFRAILGQMGEFEADGVKAAQHRGEHAEFAAGIRQRRFRLPGRFLEHKGREFFDGSYCGSRNLIQSGRLCFCHLTARLKLLFAPVCLHLLCSGRTGEPQQVG